MSAAEKAAEQAAAEKVRIHEYFWHYIHQMQSCARFHVVPHADAFFKMSIHALGTCQS